MKQEVEADKQNGSAISKKVKPAEDETLNISVASKAQQKRLKKKKRSRASKAEMDGESGKRRVKFEISKNVTREFHKHSKVATRSLPNYTEDDKPALKPAIKKRREDKLEDKKSAAAKKGISFE